MSRTPTPTGFGKYETLLEQLPVGFSYQRIVLDENGRAVDFIYLDMNELFAEYIGVNRKEALGRRATDVIPRFRDHRMQWIERYGQVAVAGKGFKLEFHSEFLRRDFRVTAYSPEPEHFATILEEIKHDFRPAGECPDLQLFRTLVDRAGDALYIVDPEDSTILDVNLEAARMLAYRRKDLIGRKAWQISQRTSSAQHWEEHAARLRDVRRALFDTVHIASTGEEVPVELHVSMVRGMGRDYMVSVARDLRNRDPWKARYETVISSTMDGFCLIDERGRIVDVNPAFCQILGGEKEELTTLFAHQLVPHESPDSVRRGLARVVQSGYERLDVQLQRRDGRIIDVEATIAWQPLGSTRYVHVFIRDVTDRNEARRLIEEHVAALNRSNSELEQFAYVASHDLQQPLRTLRGFAELLREYVAEESERKPHRYLDFITSEAMRLENMIQGLLEYSRLRAPELFVHKVDVGQVVAGAVASLAALCRDLEGRIEVGDLPSVDGNEMHLTVLFQNLIGNALKFGARPPVVRISAQQHGETWVVTVEDNGPGIPPADRQRVFRVFSRLHAEHEQPGTGIGLALCQRVVEQHGGSIRIEDSPLGGAAFLVTLPVDGNGGKGYTGSRPSTGQGEERE